MIEINVYKLHQLLFNIWFMPALNCVVASNVFICLHSIFPVLSVFGISIVYSMSLLMLFKKLLKPNKPLNM